MIEAYSSTYVKKNWNKVIDDAICEKPQIFRRNKDYLILLDTKCLEGLLSRYKLTANKIIEEDNTITLSLNELDIAVNAKNEEAAKLKLAESVLQYAEDYYDEFNYWSSSLNRRNHIPYIFRVLAIKDINKIRDLIEC